MPPTLRNSTQEKTAASAKAAKNVGYVRPSRAPRPPPSRRQYYTKTKDLVSWKRSNKLDAITITNATSSPLLLLPPELRNMIYKYALTPKRAVRVGLYYNRRGRISRSGYSAYARKGIAQDLAVALPRVCRQIYTETATMLYSENRFAFGKEKLMHKWLSKRITAQREAIRWMMLPCGVYEYGSMELAAHGWKMEGCKTREDIAKDAMKTCPNLIEMVEDKGFDKRLRGSRGQDMRCRFDDPSSGDESVWDEDSDY